MKIHPRFRLNGLRPGDDPALFCQELEKTLPVGEGSAAYARETTDFLYRCLDTGRTIRCHTSGSTGVPKTMEIEKSRMVASARMTCRRFDLGEDMRALLCLPIAYIAGRMMLVRALTAGWDLRAVVPSSRPLEQVEGRFDFAALVPLQLYESVEALSRIRKVLVGGGAVSEAFLGRLAECRLPEAAIYQSYA
ncbi:MAG TPA: AMP-binding protein, partial [Bacteroidetes bacterium]|nr:AMP-binding protein [Bacteroidota bacterium]